MLEPPEFIELEAKRLQTLAQEYLRLREQAARTAKDIALTKERLRILAEMVRLDGGFCELPWD